MGGHARSRRAGRKENFTERFTTDYDLPNDCNYSESCASIGLAMFGIRRANITRTLASLGQYVYSVGEGELYGEHPLSLSDVTLKAVPYAYWNNRGMGEMSVWIKDLVN